MIFIVTETEYFGQIKLFKENKIVYRYVPWFYRFISVLTCKNEIFWQVLKAMRESDSPRPAIFAMSNPTMNGCFSFCYQFCMQYNLSLSLLPSTLLVVLIFCFEFLYVIAECTAADAFKYAGSNIVFASGSPFENVDLGWHCYSTKQNSYLVKPFAVF